MSTGGFKQPDVSPCTPSLYLSVSLPFRQTQSMPGGAVQGDLRLAGVEEDQDAAGDQHCLHPLRVAGR